MIFDLKLIKSITMGAEKIISEDGVYKFFRFTEEEAKTTDNINLLYTAGVQMEFKTDGTKLKLSVNTKHKGDIRSLFAFDVFVDENHIGSIQNFKDEECIGNFAEKEYPLGRYSEEFSLGCGEKIVRIVFPYSVIAEMEEIKMPDATFVFPVKREKMIVAYGDSITQGYDAEHPSKTYAMRLAESFNAEIVNKGLGGETFSLKMPAVKNAKKPDFVIVSYGTNDWWVNDKETVRQNAVEFLDNIEKNYPDTKIFVITPIWRKNFKDIREFGEFSEVEALLKEICKNRKNVKVISGFDFVPMDENLLGDLRIHPNDKGFEYYFENLVKQIKNRKG